MVAVQMSKSIAWMCIEILFCVFSLDIVPDELIQFGLLSVASPVRKAALAGVQSKVGLKALKEYHFLHKFTL